MKKMIIHIILTILLSTGMACQKASDDKRHGMNFRVTEAFLGKLVNLDSLGISLTAPKNWMPLPDDMLQTMHEKMQGQAAEERMFKFTPIQFYIDHIKGCVLAISIVDFDADSTQIDFYKAYRASLNQKFSQGQIDQTLFFKDDIEMNQFFIQIPGKIIVKLVFEDTNKQLLQLDYMVPKDGYQELAEYIESSIGTIKRINTH